MPRIILASLSPQRAQLLRGLGASFDVIPSGVEEKACTESDPVGRARHLARLKAKDVAVDYPNAIVIGCDTLVVAPDGTLLEKPADVSEAERMLRCQSGGTSLVHSGLCVIAGDRVEEGMSTSRVTFALLSEEQIQWWLGTRLWEGRSGAFQIDGPGQMLIAHLEGDVTSVVGLPVFLLGTLFTQLGYSTLLCASS